MTSGAHTVDLTANLKTQVDNAGPWLSFGYFEILVACIICEIITSFWENNSILRKLAFLTLYDLNYDLNKNALYVFL